MAFVTQYLLLCIGIIACSSSNYRSMIYDTTLSVIGGVSMSMQISDAEDLVTITVTGPNWIYFSIAFGSCSMVDSWALVVPGATASAGAAPFEQNLGKNSAGDLLESSFEITEDLTFGLIRTVTVTRSLSQSMSDSYYAFSTDDDDIEVMWAYGTKADFSNHGEYQRGCSTLSFTKTEQSKTIQHPQETVLAGVSDYYWSDSVTVWSVIFIFAVCMLTVGICRYFIMKRNRANDYEAPSKDNVVETVQI